MRSLAFGKVMKQLPIDKQPQALVFESCRLWQEARDSGFQERQQLNLKPLPDSKSIETEPFHKAGKGTLWSPAFDNNKRGDNNKLLLRGGSR